MPKLRAVREALSRVHAIRPELVPAEPIIEARKVPSGVADTPRHTWETMAGAKQRALNVLALVRGEGSSLDLAVGLEGGVLREEGNAFLESWAYVTNGQESAFGSSGCIPLPVVLADRVIDAGGELGPEADRLFGTSEIAAKEGTFGVLTALLVSREDAFVRSLLHALAPFYNASAYSG